MLKLEMDNIAPATVEVDSRWMQKAFRDFTTYKLMHPPPPDGEDDNMGQGDIALESVADDRAAADGAEDDWIGASFGRFGGAEFHLRIKAFFRTGSGNIHAQTVAHRKTIPPGRKRL
eukprot:7206232-Pyramimonas_sp.AAC.1